MAISFDGSQLFLLETRWSDDLRASAHFLSLFDAREGKTLIRTTIENRILYPVTGPSGLVLAPDGSKLFVYAYKVLGNNSADYWLSIVDSTTLKALPTKILLPGCGGAWFSTAKNEIVALCGSSNDLRFIDPRTNQVVATIAIPWSGVNPLSLEGRVAGFAVTKEQGAIYVVTNDLRIVEINPNTHTIIREVTNWQREPRSVLGGSVAISRDGRHLIVGTLSNPWERNSSFSLRLFSLPLLAYVSSVLLEGPAGFAAAPNGGLYLTSQGGLMIQKSTADLNQIMPFLKPDLPVHRIVIP